MGGERAIKGNALVLALVSILISDGSITNTYSTREYRWELEIMSSILYMTNGDTYYTSKVKCQVSSWRKYLEFRGKVIV